MEEGQVDLALLGLGSGQAEALKAPLTPRPPVLGGVELDLDGSLVEARLDAARTTAGWALRLRASATVRGICVRCLCLLYTSPSPRDRS